MASCLRSWIRENSGSRTESHHVSVSHTLPTVSSATEYDTSDADLEDFLDIFRGLPDPRDPRGLDRGHHGGRDRVSGRGRSDRRPPHFPAHGIRGTLELVLPDVQLPKRLDDPVPFRRDRYRRTRTPHRRMAVHPSPPGPGRAARPRPGRQGPPRSLAG